MKKKILMLCMGLLLRQPHSESAMGRERPRQSCPGHHQCRQEHRSYVFHREQHAQQFSGDREDLQTGQGVL